MSIQQSLISSVIAASVSALSALLPDTAVAGPFNNAPGVRAQGMAGAVGALLDPASVWHNPAGVARGLPGLRMELYQASPLDAVTDELDSKLRVFAGYQKTLDVWTVGIYTYSPYHMSYGARYAGEDGRVNGRVNIAYQSISVPLAVSAGGGALRLGMTVDWNVLSFDGTQLNASLDTENPKNPGVPLTVEPKRPGGLSTSFGIIARVLDWRERGMMAHLGAVYRTEAKDSPKNAPETPEFEGDTEEAIAAQAELWGSQHRLANRLLLGKPQSMALSGSLEMALVGNARLLLGLQWDNTRWSSQLSDQRLSLGSEYSHGIGGRYDIDLAYRLGYYQSTASETDVSLDWPDMSGITLGLGVKSRGRFQIDVSAENRSIEQDNRNDSDAWYIGAGLTGSW